MREGKEIKLSIKTRNRIIWITIAVLAVAGVALLFRTKVLIPNKKYTEAVNLLENGQYEAAETLFESLYGYKDSCDQIDRCIAAINDEKYESAVTMMENGEYESAISIFESLNGYKDSAAHIEDCIICIQDRNYNDGVTLMECGDYEAAISAFKLSDGYRDSNELIYQCEAILNAISVNIGDIYVFGHFEQDNDPSNGAEDIEWIVLDKEGYKIFVISKYALWAMGYNKYRVETTWESCSLRTWLNSEFFDKAFTDEEQEQIPTVTVLPSESPKYHTDPGNATEDKVFIIGIAELNEYFPSDSERECQPTAYAVANGAEVQYNGNCWWWMRSPGINRYYAARVNCYGSLRNAGPPVSSYYSCVRPAMWIDLVPEA